MKAAGGRDWWYLRKQHLDAMTRESRSVVLDYAVAAVAVGAAGGIRAALDPVLGVYAPIYLPFTLAIILAGRLGGRGPSLAATACSVLTVWYFFIEPRDSFRIANWAQVGSLALFAVVGVLISLMVGQLRASLGAAARSKEHLRVATLSAEVGVWSRTLGTSDMEVSANWRPLFGIEPEARVTFDTWQNALHPEDRDRVVGELSFANDHDRDFKTEYRTLWPDGTVRWIVDRGRVSYDRHGHAMALDGVSVDITERKQAEDALRRTDAELKEAERIAHVGSWYWDPRTDVVTGSEETYRVYGWDPKLPMPKGKDHEQLYTAESWARARAALPGAMQGIPYAVDLEMVRADGGKKWITTRGEGVFDAHGTFVGIRGTAQDITERKRAEDALRESEAQFRTLANAIPQLCWMAHADGGIFWYNQRWYEYTGSVPEEMEGWGWQTVHDPAALPNVLERWNASIAAGTPFDMVFPLRGADGVYHPFLTRVVPVRDRDGKIARWFGTNTDISEQRKIEEALRESEDQLRTFVRNAPAGVAMLDREMRYLQVSDRWCADYSLSSDEMLGRTHYDIFPDIPERWKEIHRRCLAGETLRSDEDCWERGGDQMWLRWEIRPWGEREGNPEGVLIFSEDITGRKQMEATLRESEATIRTLLETAAQAILAVSADGAIVIANRMAEDMFGYQPNDLVGRPLEMLLPPNLRERHRAHRADFESNPRPRPMGIGVELQGLRKDGSRFPIEVSLSAVETLRGRLAVSFVTDITERKRAETALQNREQELRALAGSLLTAQEDERRRIARDLHDDVTQRLAILSIEIGKLAGGADPSVEARARLRSLQKQVVQISQEVRRLSHGLHPAVIEDFGLSTALEELCEEFGKAPGITVRFDGPIDDAGLSRDAAACLYRIAQESLGNAAKHGRATEVRVALSAKGGTMQLLVTDNGAGFSGEPWRSRVGLGLVSMKERVRLVNGTFTITSRAGQGTEIIASVPLPLSGGDGETSADSAG